MPKYQVIKDIKILDTVALKEGSEIEILDGESIKIDTKFGIMELKFEDFKSFIKEKETIQVSIIPLEDEDVVKEYRLQLDIKTTRKKAREIENYLRETLGRMI
jgi:hypothetical protein